jgi:calcium permeable stress-gated cation channel
LGFAAIGFYCVYVSYRYNLIYVYDSEVDTRGLLYPRALKQILTGVYLAEICLLGLFGLGGSAGPVILMIMLLVFTVLIHFSLNEALGPLLFNLPKTLAVEEDDQQLPGNGKDNMGVVDLEQYGADFDFGPQDSDVHDTVVHGEQQSRAVEGAEGAAAFVSSSLKAIILSKFKTSVNIDGYVGKVDFWTRLISPDPNVKPNFIMKWLHPEIYEDYTVLRRILPPDLPDPVLQEDYVRKAYYQPSMVAPAPVLWIPRDLGGVSQQEVAHTSKVIEITDEGAYLDEKNRIVTDIEGPSPVILEKILW